MPVIHKTELELKLDTGVLKGQLLECETLLSSKFSARCWNEDKGS